jgi:hypothetical protein
MVNMITFARGGFGDAHDFKAFAFALRRTGELSRRATTRFFAPNRAG